MCEKNKIQPVIIVVLAWLIALALLYLAILKILFSSASKT